jgi:hypothetical protein
MQIQIRHHFRDIEGYYVSYFFKLLRKNLEIKYPEYEFQNILDPKYENFGYGGIHSCMSMSIINPESGKYIVISFFDNWKYHFMRHIGWEPNKMVKFFYPGGFNYIDYYNWMSSQKDNPDIVKLENIEQVYCSFFYGPMDHRFQDEITELYMNRNSKETIPKMFFKGWLWDFREKMLVNIKDESIEWKEKREQQSPYLKYLQELSVYRTALSLPGGTEVCNRDIECFAAGIPVLRPFLNINYPEPLIPNYHYISCYTDCKYWDGNPIYLSYEDFSKSVEYYWSIVKDNYEYLDFVSKNARKWYVDNCTIQNNVDYVLNQITMGDLV